MLILNKNSITTIFLIYIYLLKTSLRIKEIYQIIDGIKILSMDYNLFIEIFAIEEDENRKCNRSFCN